MRRRQVIGASGIVFAAIFVLSAVLGDGMLNGGKATKAAAQIPLPEMLMTDTVTAEEPNQVESSEIETDEGMEKPPLKKMKTVETDKKAAGAKETEKAKEKTKKETGKRKPERKT